MSDSTLLPLFVNFVRCSVVVVQVAFVKVLFVLHSFCCYFNYILGHRWNASA